MSEPTAGQLVQYIPKRWNGSAYVAGDPVLARIGHNPNKIDGSPGSVELHVPTWSGLRVRQNVAFSANTTTMNTWTWLTGPVVDPLADDLEAVQEDLEEAQDDLATAEDTIEARDATIATHLDTIAARDTTIATHVATIATRDATIATQEDTITTHLATIATRDATIVTRDATIATYLAAATAVIAKLDLLSGADELADFAQTGNDLRTAAGVATRTLP